MIRFIKEDFIAKAEVIHKYYYNYDKAIYSNSRIKIIITCPIHGDFEQLPSAHLQGQGCPKCGKETKSENYTLTTQEFIEKAKLVHGNIYDYSKVVYTGARNKVIIMCPIHGEFEQLASNHMYKSGCYMCGMDAKKLTKEEFIEKAKKIHGDRYDYSKVIYVNSVTKIIIICPEHGEFEQIPINHSTGSKCPICSNEKVGNLKRSNRDEFVGKAISIHGNKYDYNKVEYIDARTKIIVTCPVHGDFEQLPSSHLSGNSCIKCGIEKTSNVRRSNTQEFIQKAREVHGDKYDYSKVNYIGSLDKIIIMCPKHRDFEQLPVSHLQGVGCPKCNRSKGEIAISDILENIT